MGRIDDVLNVAGHRLGTMEIESALVAHPGVAEAAVVGKPHEVKGEAVFAYVVLRGERPQGSAAFALIEELRGWVASQLSPIAKPDEVRITDNLPKTRSGKIMRRLLRSIARGDEITQDVSTLENPAILEQLRGLGSAPPARGTAPSPGPAGRSKQTVSTRPPAASRPATRQKVARGAKPAASAKPVAQVKRAAAKKRSAPVKRRAAAKKPFAPAKRPAPARRPAAAKRRAQEAPVVRRRAPKSPAGRKKAAAAARSRPRTPRSRAGARPGAARRSSRKGRAR
jgi:hypothetical protein